MTEIIQILLREKYAPLASRQAWANDFLANLTTPSNSTNMINPNQTNKSISTKFMILFQQFRISNTFQVYT